MKRILVIGALLIGAWLSLPWGAALAAVYREGDSGQEILAVQQRLRSLGYAVGKQDGVFHPLTASAVRAFQQQQGLQATGVVDEGTYQKLMGQAQPSAVLVTQPLVVTERKVATVAKKGTSSLPPLPKFKEGRPGNSVQETAQQYLGVPYRFGGATPQGFDCSGFVMYVFQKHGIKLPRTADVQYTIGRIVDKSRLQPGDVVFFTTYEKGASHEGIYLGQERFVHASSSRGVMISALSEPYWKSRYLGARRMG
jgi:cell wall-associated NlpC family hydrolase